MRLTLVGDTLCMSESTLAPTPVPTPAPRRRWSRLIGIGLILAGLSVLGYVAWQFWGTNYVSQRKHQEIVKTVEEAWLLEKEPRVPEGDVLALILIPKFGDDYVVPVLEGTSDEVLAAGYGHFEDSQLPGEVGNFALAGHRVTHGEPLRRMPELDPGDEIIVETREATYTYVLTTGGDDLVVPFTGVWVLDKLPDNPAEGGVEPAQKPGQKLITLTTCSEIFHTDNRMIAFGILQSRQQR